MLQTKTDTGGKMFPHSSAKSPPLQVTLVLLIGKEIGYPAPIRRQNEQEEIRKLRLNPEEAPHAADSHSSHGQETTGGSPVPRRISRDLTALNRATGRPRTATKHEA